MPPPGQPSRLSATLSLLYPNLSRAKPAAQRIRPNSVADVYPRPGIPSLGKARLEAMASVAAGVTGGDAAAALLKVVLDPWVREKPGKDGTTFPEKLWAHWLQTADRQGASEWQVTTLTWAAERLISADGPSVNRYLLHILPFLVEISGMSRPLSHWAIRRFMKRLSTMRGCHRQAPRPTITHGQYTKFITSISIDPWLRAGGALAWRRMGRVADTAEVRQGGLWVADGTLPLIKAKSGDLELILEIPFHKAKPGGAWDRVGIVVDPVELGLLLPYITRLPPTGPPLSRPLMFPLLTAAVMADALEAVLGSRVGGHVFRRSALRNSLAAGVPLQTAILLSLHSSVDSALAYVLSPDAATLELMLQASRTLGRDWVDPSAAAVPS
jgi:hypothetical protein